ILDVRIAAAVLVDDDDGGPLHLVRRTDEIAVDALAGRIIRNDVDGEPRVIRRHHRGPRVVVLQQWQKGERGGGRTGELCQAVEEPAAADAAMRELVVEIDDALVHELCSGKGCEHENPTGKTVFRLTVRRLVLQSRRTVGTATAGAVSEQIMAF